MQVWIYIDRRGPVDELKVFASQEAADQWFKEHDPEGVAFKYDVLGSGDGTKSPRSLLNRRT
jgi:hypothetical protein